MTSSDTIGLALSSSLAGRGPLLVGSLTIHASLGALFAWSASLEPLRASSGWSDAAIPSPYRYALVWFLVGLFLASGYSRRLSPRTLARFGGFLLVFGCLFSVWAGLSVSAITVGIGIFGGLGAGFAYFAPISTYRHWLPAGGGPFLRLTVICFSAGPLVAAPALLWILKNQLADNTLLIRSALLILALLFLLGVAAMGEMLPGTRAWLAPRVFDTLLGDTPHPQIARQRAWDRSVMPLLRIWLQWSVFFVGAFAGTSVLLDYLPNASAIPWRSAWVFMGICVVALAISNHFGRVVWASLALRMGRTGTLLTLVSLSVCLCMLISGGRILWSLTLAMLALLGFGFGGFLGVMPQLAAEMIDGKVSLPLRFGIMYSAFGLCACAAPYWSSPRNMDAFGNIFLLTLSAAMLLGFLYLLIRPVRTGSSVSQALSRW